MYNNVFIVLLWVVIRESQKQSYAMKVFDNVRIPVISILHVSPMPTELFATHRYVRARSSPSMVKKLTLSVSDVLTTSKTSVSFSVLIDHSKSTWNAFDHHSKLLRYYSLAEKCYQLPLKDFRSLCTQVYLHR